MEQLKRILESPVTANTTARGQAGSPWSKATNNQKYLFPTQKNLKNSFTRLASW